MYAEESPWFNTGRSDVMGRVWFPDDHDTWYRFDVNMERIYRKSGDAVWAQGWRG